MEGVLRCHGTVLIAEGEKLFADVYETMVKSFRPEYSILTAKNGVEAIGLIESNRIDVLIMGLRMQRVDGFEVIEHLLEKNIMLPTVIITAMWYCFREMFQPSGIIMIKEDPSCSRECEILRRYRPMIFGFYPVPVNKIDFLNAIARCEEYRACRRSGGSIGIWQDSVRYA